MKLEEFESVGKYPKHNLLISILGLSMIILYLYTVILKGIQFTSCIPFLWLGVRLYHFSYLGYNDLLVTIYYTYLRECIRRGVNVNTYKKRCIAKYRDVSIANRYIYSFYKSSVSGLHNILTLCVIGTITLASITLQSFVSNTKTNYIKPSSYIRPNSNTRLLTIAKDIENYINYDIDYNILYGINDLSTSNETTFLVDYCSDKPQIGIVVANIKTNTHDVECTLYIDTYTSEILAITQYFNHIDKTLITYTKTNNLTILADELDSMQKLLDKYPNFRVVHTISEFRIYE